MAGWEHTLIAVLRVAAILLVAGGLCGVYLATTSNVEKPKPSFASRALYGFVTGMLITMTGFGVVIIPIAIIVAITRAVHWLRGSPAGKETETCPKLALISTMDVELPRSLQPGEHARSV